jgi:hypothetical protein
MNNSSSPSSLFTSSPLPSLFWFCTASGLILGSECANAPAELGAVGARVVLSLPSIAALRVRLSRLLSVVPFG